MVDETDQPSAPASPFPAHPQGDEGGLQSEGRQHHLVSGQLPPHAGGRGGARHHRGGHHRGGSGFDQAAPPMVTPMMIYTTVGTNDLIPALGFYAPLFAEMGLDQCWLDGTSASWGRKDDASVTRFSIGYPFAGGAMVGNGSMTAFRIGEIAGVDRLHELALRHGGSDEGAPGRRPRYGGGFYGAYVRDPEGNKLAFICYAAEPTTSETGPRRVHMPGRRRGTKMARQVAHGPR